MTERETSHIWLGRFEPELAEKYFAEHYGDKEEGAEDADRYEDEDAEVTPISEFAAEQRESWYDHDFVELTIHEEPVAVRTLVEGHSYAEHYLEQVAAQAAELGIDDANVFILADKEEFETPRTVSGKGYQLWYLGEFEYPI